MFHGERLVQMDSDFKIEIQDLLIIKRDVHGAIEIGNVEDIDKYRENPDRDEDEE